MVWACFLTALPVAARTNGAPPRRLNQVGDSGHVRVQWRGSNPYRVFQADSLRRRLLIGSSAKTGVGY